MSIERTRRVLLFFSYAAALSGFFWPHWGVPVDYDAILWRNIPFACVWGATYLSAYYDTESAAYGPWEAHHSHYSGPPG